MHACDRGLSSSRANANQHGRVPCLQHQPIIEHQHTTANWKICENANVLAACGLRLHLCACEHVVDLMAEEMHASMHVY